MSVQTISVEIPYSFQGTYKIPHHELSFMLACDNGLQAFLEKVGGVSDKVFKKAATLNLMEVFCQNYNEFSGLLKRVQKTSEDKLDSLQIPVRMLEEKWAMKGVYCAQIGKGKNCMEGQAKIPTFLYKDNKLFKYYKRLKQEGEIKAFEGSADMKDPTFNKYLNFVYQKVQVYDLELMLKAMKIGGVVKESAKTPQGSTATSYRLKKGYEL